MKDLEALIKADIANLEEYERDCFSCGGKGATGPGTVKACCMMHQPIGIIRCHECNGSGKVKSLRRKGEKS